MRRPLWYDEEGNFLSARHEELRDALMDAWYSPHWAYTMAMASAEALAIKLGFSLAEWQAMLAEWNEE
jgi:hypothetical protein